MGEKKVKGECAYRFFRRAERIVSCLFFAETLFFLLCFVISLSMRMWHENTEETLRRARALSAFLFTYGVTAMIAVAATEFGLSANGRKRENPRFCGEPCAVRSFISGALLAVCSVVSVCVFVSRSLAANFFGVFHPVLLFTASVLFFIEGGVCFSSRRGEEKAGKAEGRRGK